MGGITYKLYESTQKDYDNLRGIIELDEKYNPFLEGPCFLSIAAKIMTPRANFGVGKQAKQMARIRIRNNGNAGFNIDEVPIKFLSLHYSYIIESDYTYDDIAQKFVIDKFLPLVSKNGEKIDVLKAMKNMRNVNILTYCNGTKYYKEMENILIAKLKELGYSEEEQLKILSQICIFPIATYVLDGTEKSTYIGFRDINDSTLETVKDEKNFRKVKESKIGEYLAKYSNNVYEYLYYGDGQHYNSLPKYSKVGQALPVCLASVVTRALENSVNNSKSNSKFVPVSASLLINDIREIMKKIENGQTKEELMQELDEKLSYGNSRKMSEEELEILDNIDMISDRLVMLNENIRINPENKKNVESLKEKMKISDELTQLINRFSLERQFEK